MLDDARRAQITEQLCKELAAIKGIAAVFGPEQFAELGQPTRDQDPHAPDLWLVAKRAFSFGGSPLGENVVTPLATVIGHHGYLPDQPDMLAMCVVWGPEIKAGSDLGKIRETDLAPMIARILGLKMPDTP